MRDLLQRCLSKRRVLVLAYNGTVTSMPISFASDNHRDCDI